ncbi:MAG: 2-dehydropantoate 2-reductase, partial [Rhodospirillaceae bacterium]|nr:2-dehydropantoate 2-reductase [Rhodospirillaceae bacterium]
GRGPHLAALQSAGATISVDGEEFAAQPRCAAGPEGLPPQDYVFVTAKSPSLPAIVPRLAALIGPAGTVVTVMNGLPWWMFPTLQSGDARPAVSCLDPGGVLARALPLGRILGCVANIGATVSAPGRVSQSKSALFTFGEPDGAPSDRLKRIVEATGRAGLVVRASGDIRRAYWQKLMGNASFGPISVLAGATNGQIGTDPALRRLCLAIMGEIARVGECLGFAAPADLEERIGIGARLADHKTSMLQDFEAGRPLEIDSIVTPIVELARTYKVETPALDSVWALLRHRGAMRGAGRAGASSA